MLNTIWLIAYPFRQIKDSILYFDKAPSHMIKELDTLFQNNNSEFRLIPSGLTSVCQPLDLCFNKPFKDTLRANIENFVLLGKIQKNQLQRI